MAGPSKAMVATAPESLKLFPPLLDRYVRIHPFVHESSESYTFHPFEIFSSLLKPRDCSSQIFIMKLASTSKWLIMIYVGDSGPKRHVFSNRLYYVLTEN